MRHPFGRFLRQRHGRVACIPVPPMAFRSRNGAAEERLFILEILAMMSGGRHDKPAVAAIRPGIWSTRSHLSSKPEAVQEGFIDLY
ncbi:hypothetical protein [Paracoccus aerius]|uniref:Uncharacterized protein n=2 Tax=Paracoccus TaxID=265 RepID=A0ABS1S954_9RHOB|nr:hypothetical protein [Paracoccus aerius]MBL3675276.1 hypothetical protein [Paracoccus aerius]